MTRVVVDSSLAIKWLFIEDQSTEAIAQLRDWVSQGVERLVPSWFMCELANVVYQRVRQRIQPLQDAQANFRDIVRFVRILDAEPGVSLRALQLAHDLGQGATYDTHYLSLAEQLDCDLWTADEHFWRAAISTHGRVKWIGQSALQPPAMFDPST
ncbi:MAG TPA: type II toxin-antitoxin system VapC family toxin [Thermomicrobiales bacterium]|jgi:predicted nucleic acid-binding protein